MQTADQLRTCQQISFSRSGVIHIMNTALPGDPFPLCRTGAQMQTAKRYQEVHGQAVTCKTCQSFQA